MAMNTLTQTKAESNRRQEQANVIQENYYKERNGAIKELEKVQKEHEPLNERYVASLVTINSVKKHIESLEKLMQLKLDDQHKKLIVKYERGLLLYGPPETGT
ncbi:unnamed protein product [Didymodactylos carnosus]|uniref:Uncharacterized protein n=1 Tax=Didymodactylos carnosus TaxID=1234261 RepID=A0A8S2GB95_9BILA|nr:unnamed protein product [Didymodactylos carnosus]CAF4486776.1 unnamed protein product [Didymodactylos carnosus]